MDLASTIHLRDRVADALVEESNTPSMFLSPDRTHLLRSATDSGRSPEGTSANDMTATSFALYMSFADVRELSAANRALRITQTDLELEVLTSWLVSRMCETYSVAVGGLLRSDDRSGTDVLPNAYNTSLHVAGLVSALESIDPLDDFIGRQPNLLPLLVGAARWLATQIGADHSPGALSGTGLVADDRNPYIWYWTCVAAQRLSNFLERHATPHQLDGLQFALDELKTKLRRARDSAQHRVSELIAYHHSGVEGFTDATDFLFTLAVAGSRSEEQRYAGSAELIAHGLDVFLERHVSVEGSIYPRSTAFVDNDKNAITISSAEHCAVLLEVHRSRLHAVPSPIASLVNYTLDRRTGRFGWGARSGEDENLPQRPIFVCSAAMNFLRGVHALLQNNVSTQALQFAGLNSRRPNANVGRLKLDSALVETFGVQIVDPISRGARHEAALSIVLYGPPGTAKTTCAEKLAWMLGWPIVELSPALFLRDGIDRVDASADRVFEQLSLLEDTVVLFDEFEEMIRERAGGSREGRFLTTSMLPRLHHIRDEGKIVFVIATNSIDAIDAAARRFGRVDMVLPVDYPSEAVREEMFETVLTLFPEAVETARHLRALGFPKAWRTAREAREDIGEEEAFELAETLTELHGTADPFRTFGWGHIKEVVRRGNAVERSGAVVGFGSVASLVKEVAAHDNPLGTPPADGTS